MLEMAKSQLSNPLNLSLYVPKRPMTSPTNVRRLPCMYKQEYLGKSLE